MMGGIFGGGGSSSTQSAQKSDITNNTSVGVTFDFEELGTAIEKSAKAQNELEREMYLFKKDMTEQEYKDLKEKEKLDLIKYEDEKKYKKYMLWLGGAGLAVALLK